jgi:hypothetical protein
MSDPIETALRRSSIASLKPLNTPSKVVPARTPAAARLAMLLCIPIRCLGLPNVTRVGEGQVGSV